VNGLLTLKNGYSEAANVGHPHTNPALTPGRQAGTFEQHGNLQNVSDNVANPFTHRCLTLFHPTEDHIIRMQ
jgi:hypothetical protein